MCLSFTVFILLLYFFYLCIEIFQIQTYRFLLLYYFSLGHMSTNFIVFGFLSINFLLFAASFPWWKSLFPIKMNLKVLVQYFTPNNFLFDITGVVELKEALARFYKRTYDVTYNIDNEICVASSGTEALYASFKVYSHTLSCALGLIISPFAVFFFFFLNHCKKTWKTITLLSFVLLICYFASSSCFIFVGFL